MKLYGKLIFWFLLANLVAAAVAVLISSRLWTRDYSDEDATRDGQAAVQVFESQGPRGLERWLRHRRSEGVFGMLADEEGKPLTRGYLPGHGRVGHVPPPPDAEGPEPDEHARMQSISVVSASGKSYRWTAVIGPPRGRRAHHRDMLLNVTIGLFAIAGVALLAARRIAGPISDLRSATLLLAEGKLETRVAAEVTGRGDELGELGRSFNEMAARLQRQLETQRQLLRDVSHELRSPLARLRIASELARGEPAAVHLDRIDQEADRLEELIAQVLLIARLESPVSATTRETFDVTELAREVYDDAQLEAQQRKVALQATFGDGCTLSGHPDLIQSAIENVLRNAIRYTAEGTAVEIDAGSDARTWRIAIADHGPGVPPDQLETIFKPFHRVSTARDRDSGGYGLGLAIAERAVTAHGGSITAQNLDRGGLRVEIVLPL